MPALALLLLGLACGPETQGAGAPASPQDAGSDGGGDGGSQDGWTVSLPDQVHELSDLVCEAPDGLELRWSLDGEPWPGEASTTAQPGDTIPAHELRAGQSWRCEARASDGAEHAADSVVAPYAHPVVLEPLDAGPGDTVTLHYRGQLLDSGSPVFLDLGFDGWSPQGEHTPVQDLTSDGDPLYLARHELDADGRLELVLPPDIHSLHLSFYAQGDQPREDDEVLWGLQLPALGPWLTVDPDGTLAVHFLSTARGPATVDLSWEGGSLQVEDDSTDELHHLRLEGVPADTDLDYTITEASGRSSSTWTTHRLDPAATELTVLAAADMQDNGLDEQRWQQVALAMGETAPDADLLILPGDLAANDHPGLWWLYLAHGGELFATVPQVIAAGNHDTPGRASNPDTTSILRYFDPLGDGPGAEVGRYACGPLDLVVLNTELEDELQPGGAQYLWAEQSLLEGGPGTFTAVAFHRPAYDVGARFADEQHLFRQVTGLFDQRVDLVLMGHEHIYQRFQPLQYDSVAAPSGRYGRGQDDGVAYVILPAAGNYGLFDQVVTTGEQGGELLPLVASPELEADQDTVENFHGFVEIRIEGSRMEAQTWRVSDDDRSVVDLFIVER